MSFQRCPVCDGAGFVMGMGGQLECSTCHGHKIIDEATGCPPTGPNSVTSTKLELFPDSPYKITSTSGDEE